MTNAAESVRAEHAPVRDILSALQAAIGPQKFNAWFKHGTKVSLEDGHCKVAVPNPFVANWVEQHFAEPLAGAVLTHTGQTLPVVVAVDSNLSSECTTRDLDRQAELVQRTRQGRTRQSSPQPPASLKYRLEDFVVGASNKLAYSSAIAVAGGGASSPAQLFIHGSCGVGKTHLLQGICQAYAAQGRNAGREFRCRYVTGEQFTNEFIFSLKNKQADEFRQRYRNLDLLAIDDVHFLAAKRATQDEFLHTYNAIATAGRKVILASDAHPRLVGDLHEQLVSRFLAGLVVKIDTPDEITRRALLEAKARTANVALPDDVMEYLVRHLRGSVREMEGTLVKLSALAGLEGGTVSLALARDALADDLARSDSATTLGDIEATVAAYFGITPADIHSSRRTQAVSSARMVAMFLARRHTTMSFPEIGRFMGKNHSSVVLAVQRMEDLLAKRKEVKWTTPAGRRAVDAAVLLELLEEQL
jgi:chromosomal replication initiator protein